MGPTLLFDKSFLQSLNLDEAVWLNHFFLCNICPLFYIETLSDLSKPGNKGRSPHKIVGELANKFPEGGMPSVFHVDLSIANLMGQPVPMNGQIPMNRGRPVKKDGLNSVVIEEAAEAMAFSRWQEGRFFEVEESTAKIWRNRISTLELNKSLSLLDDFNVEYAKCKDLENARQRACSFFSSIDNRDAQIRFTFLFLSVNPDEKKVIYDRWNEYNMLPLIRFAPYAAFTMIIELFFLIAMKRGMISSRRASNKIDILYLYYLPFTTIFVSSDKLHRRCAPLFLKSDQEFIWGPDLKRGLTCINEYYKKFSDEVKEKGLDAFALYPPEDNSLLVTEIWERHGRLKRNAINDSQDKKPKEHAILDEINSLADAPSITTEEVDFDISNPDRMLIKHRVQVKKGSWYQLPKDIDKSIKQ